MRKYESIIADTSTSHSHKLICPYCKKEHTDPYEFFDSLEESVERDCYECGRRFMAKRSVSVTYYGLRAIEESKQIPKCPRTGLECPGCADLALMCHLDRGAE